MRDNHVMLATLAVAIFIASAFIVALPSEDSDASVGGNVGVRFYNGDSATVNFYAQVDNEWVLGISMRYYFDNGDLFFYYTCYESFGRLYFDASKTPYGDPSDPDEYFFSFSPSADGVEHNGGGNYANIPNGTVEYLGGVYENYNTKMELESTSGLTVVSNTYTLYTEVAFNANGGSGTPSTPVTNTTTSDASDGLADISMQIPTAIPTREGYTFKGYSYSSSGSLVLTKAEVEAGASLDVPAGMEVTLYAQWEELSYTVNFLRSEGEVIDSVSVKGGQTVPIPEEPTAPEGYFFVGWYTDNTHSTPFDFSKPINQDTNVYAYFQEELYFTSEPKALYTVTKIAGVDNTYVFQVLEESNSTTVHWDFGDGNTSDKRFVSHYFEKPGTYSVTLTVYNSQGEATDTFDVVIPADDEGGLGLLLYVAAVLIAVVIVAVIVTRFV